MEQRQRRELRRLVSVANRSHRFARESARAALTHVRTAGDALCAARDICGRGEWGRWLLRSFDGSIRTAQRYMRVARYCRPIRGNTTRASRFFVGGDTTSIRQALARAAHGPGCVAAAAEAGALVVAGARRRQSAVEFVRASLARTADGLRGAAFSDDDAVPYLRNVLLDVRNDLRITSADDARGALVSVYFIEALTTSRVKIGVASDVAARLRQLATASPYELRLMATMPGGRVHEAAIHERFGYARLTGEWFQLVPELRRYIASAASNAEARETSRDVSSGGVLTPAVD